MSERSIENLKHLEQDVKDMYKTYKRKEADMTHKEKDKFLSVLKLLSDGTADILKMIEGY